jgi:hypothetical protein
MPTYSGSRSALLVDIIRSRYTVISAHSSDSQSSRSSPGRATNRFEVRLEGRNSIHWEEPSGNVWASGPLKRVINARLAVLYGRGPLRLFWERNKETIISIASGVATTAIGTWVSYQLARN